MGNINWESVWNSSLKNKELFPFIKVKDNAISLACPTRFSNSGEVAIQVSASFNDDSIVLELLTFNDNVSIDDFVEVKSDNISSQLAKYELSNRVMERFKIKSIGFNSEKEAVNALVDYMNNKATESGRMFDDKLDELLDVINTSDNQTKHEKLVQTIRESRAIVLSKVCSILKEHYSWKTLKTEKFSDSTLPLYDRNGNLVAVVSLADQHIIIDLGSKITSKIDLVQSDEEIEEEIINDVDNANAILADQELSELQELVSDNHAAIMSKQADHENYLNMLEQKVLKLENLYIKTRLHRS